MRTMKLLVMFGVYAQLGLGCVQDDSDSASEPVDERGYSEEGEYPEEPHATESGESTSESSQTAGEMTGSGPCWDLHVADPNNGDGDYEIELDGHYVIVTCIDMHTSPKEYLTLVYTGADANYSAYGTGQNTSSPAVKTQFTRVRFDPTDLTIDVTDKRFSTSNGGWAEFGWSFHYAWNYAHAADCHSDWSQTGRANIDLGGTPFAVARDQFMVTGYNPAGSTEFSADDQVVDLTGGGYCGDNAPANFRLQLVWLP